MSKSALPCLAALLAMAGCAMTEEPATNAVTNGAAAAPSVTPSIYATEEGRDEHSYARPWEARVTNVSLDLDVDFERERVVGIATLDIAAEPGVDEVVLDSRGLEIMAVTNAAGEALNWTLGESDAVHGAPLTIELDGASQVRIAYASAPDASALQWLNPAQTAGGEQPFLFSQGQAILNRSWIPTQDSPGIRQTWDAHITVPEGLTAAMSAANCDRPDPTPAEAGKRSFCFEMTKPVPPLSLIHI